MESKKRSFSPLVVVLSLSAAFFFIFILISGVLFLTRSPSSWEGNGGGSAGLFPGGDAIGVLEINGVIINSKKTLRQIKRFKENKRVKGVVVRVNSPGGSVAPSQEIYEAIKALGKPTVTSMGSVAASGGYYVAMGTNKVFANPGTITGSIGVIMQFANLQDLYKWAKIKPYAIKTGRYKDTGSDNRPMRPDEEKLLRGMLDDVLLQFKQAVAEGRKMKMSKVNKVADGRIFSGAQAKRANLVDELGTLQDAINDVAKTAGIEGEPKVIYPNKDKRKWIDFVLDQNPDDEDAEGSTSSLILFLKALLRGTEASTLSGVQAIEQRFAPGVYWLWNGP